MKDRFLTGSKFIESEEEPLEYDVVRLLAQKKMKIATAESCTAGLISRRIANVSGSSAVFDCGIVSYANNIKHKLLFVEEDLLSRYGAVSAPVAAQMAKGALIQGESDIAVSVTGIAGPTSDNTQKPVGLVFVALCDKENRLWVREMHFESEYDDIREHNRYCSASCALDLAKEYLDAYPDLKGYEDYDEFIAEFR